ncbi:hypothetical protein [Luteimicrobium subarcticum]|uniref:Uncharacterized protein n=1 Tax=Luteimicrobium subarcticum TaxID=620910 RepID=A0A2M8WW94_9MICO|nr:hypothetical protein [Luteimicrobium subarcticum]PJI95194.1 hypothetical protein CLV34_0067 [Luteimicrobium subarcticum]
MNCYWGYPGDRVECDFLDEFLVGRDPVAIFPPIPLGVAHQIVELEVVVGGPSTPDAGARSTGTVTHTATSYTDGGGSSTSPTTSGYPAKNSGHYDPTFVPHDKRQSIAEWVLWYAADMDDFNRCDSGGAWFACSMAVASVASLPLGGEFDEARAALDGTEALIDAGRGIVESGAGRKAGEASASSASEAEAAVRAMPGSVTVGSGPSLDNISVSQATRIQNAANRIDQPISLVGSRAPGRRMDTPTGTT